MVHEALPISPLRPSIPPAVLDALGDALATETQLIEALTTLILAQRDAVHADDLQAVNDAVFAAHRLLLTLGEARNRRRAINRLLGYGKELSVQQLDTALGAQMTPRIRTEREALQDAARRLSGEIGVNRQLLRNALELKTPR